jgi:hypothetical protein
VKNNGGLAGVGGLTRLHFPAFGKELPEEASRKLVKVMGGNRLSRASRAEMNFDCCIRGDFLAPKQR